MVCGAGGVGYCSARVLSARFDLPALCIESARPQDVHRVSSASSSSTIAFDLKTLHELLYLQFFILFIGFVLNCCFIIVFFCDFLLSFVTVFKDWVSSNAKELV